MRRPTLYDIGTEPARRALSFPFLLSAFAISAFPARAAPARSSAFCLKALYTADAKRENPLHESPALTTATGAGFGYHPIAG
jgi:hypothetical protein